MLSEVPAIASRYIKRQNTRDFRGSGPARCIPARSFYYPQQAEEYMKVLVTAKRVVDYNVSIRVLSDNTGVDLNNVKMSVNPFDEIAIEEAVRLKEAGTVEEVVVASVGTSACQEQIRTCLALGADRGILVETDEDVQPLGIAKVLTAIIEKESPDLIITGKQAIDGDNSQTGPMLAALSGLSQATFASVLDVGDGTATVTREIDGGLQTITVKLPAVITTDLRLNEPRYASLPNIMKAKKKPIDTYTPEDLGVEVTPRVKTLKVEPPPERQAGIIVETAEELVDKLRNEAKVIS